MEQSYHDSSRRRKSIRAAAWGNTKAKGNSSEDRWISHHEALGNVVSRANQHDDYVLGVDIWWQPPMGRLQGDQVKHSKHNSTGNVALELRTTAPSPLRAGWPWTTKADRVVFVGDTTAIVVPAKLLLARLEQWERLNFKRIPIIDPGRSRWLVLLVPRRFVEAIGRVVVLGDTQK